jgi:DNA-binding NarL/FixJ family response regulator
MTAGAADEESGPLRVFLVDDHAIVRAGVRGYLELTGDITVAGKPAAGSRRWTPSRCSSRPARCPTWC